MALDEAGIDRRRETNSGCAATRARKREVCPDPEHRGLGESAAQPAESRRAILSPGDDLGDHRIVERA